MAIRVLESDGNSVYETTLEEMSFHNRRWVDVSQPTTQELDAVAEKVGIPIRDLNESVDPNERPRIDEIQHYTSIALKAPYKKEKILRTTSTGYFLSEQLLVTVHKRESAAIDKLFAEKEKLLTAFNKSCTRLFVRAVEDDARHYFELLDEVEDDIDELESRVFVDPKPEVVREIFRIKKTLIYFHKALTANMDVIYKLEKDPGENIDENHLTGLRYVHDDLLQMIDMTTTYKDLLTGSLDIYLTSVSNNMNAIMKRMTALASLVLIPTFITGLYGMNFEHMPELGWPYGYLFAWGLILGSMIFLYIYFKKKDWF